MATIKVKAAPSKLAVVRSVESKELTTPQAVLSRMQQSLVQLANLVTNIELEALAPTLTEVKRFAGVIESAEAALKARVVLWVQSKGTTITEKGTKRIEAEGWKLDIQPNRTGFDPKKVEALLRNKGFDPIAGMDSKISYSVNDGKLKDLLAMDEGITEDELEGTRYDLTFKVVAKQSTET